MKNLLKKQKSNKKIIFIDGLWDAGKTSLCTKVSDELNYSFLKEPLLREKMDSESSSKYYELMHLENINFLHKQGRKQDYICERSILATLAFYYCKNNKNHPNYDEYIRKLEDLDNTTFFFLYYDYGFIEGKNLHKDLNFIYSNKSFFDRYCKFYIENIPRNSGIKIVPIKVNVAGSYIKTNKIINIMKKNISKNKKYVECASIIAFHEKKVLLLLNHNNQHYVFPQGHNEPGESLRETAKREFTEETGFTDFNIDKKIYKYQYHYSQVDYVKYKKIHVYLAEIQSLKAIDTKFEGHENYSNHFFTLDQAQKKLKWKQDGMILESIVKKPLIDKLSIRGR